jgi:hypothetical protein
MSDSENIISNEDAPPPQVAVKPGQPNWCIRIQYPECSGFYHVLENTPNPRVGIRYFDDARDTWLSVSRIGRGIRMMVEDDNFIAWLFIPGISDLQHK